MDKKLKEIESAITNTKAWKCLYLEVPAGVLEDVKGYLAKAIYDWHEKKILEANTDGIKRASDIANTYNSCTTHPYMLGDCILGKLNVLKGKIRKNKQQLKEPVDSWKPLDEFMPHPLKKGLEICVCAAVLDEHHNIIRGHRHSDCIQTILNRDRKMLKEQGAQGFITSLGRYVDRELGRKLQDAAGIESVSEDGYMGKTLYSEDLY